MVGGLADTAITRAGRKQVSWLRRRMVREPAAVAIYSSPLPRAANMARLLAADLRIEMFLRPRLREIDCGRLDGVVLAEVQRNYPAEWEANLCRQDPEFRWPGGESYREFRGRCVDELQAIAAAHDGERVLVATHSGVINQVVGWLHGVSPARWDPFLPDNTSLTEIHWMARGPVLVRFNDREHLRPENAELKAAC